MERGPLEFRRRDPALDLPQSVIIAHSVGVYPPITSAVNALLRTSTCTSSSLAIGTKVDGA